MFCAPCEQNDKNRKETGFRKNVASLLSTAVIKKLNNSLRCGS